MSHWDVHANDQTTLQKAEKLIHVLPLQITLASGNMASHTFVPLKPYQS